MFLVIDFEANGATPFRTAIIGNPLCLYVAMSWSLGIQFFTALCFVGTVKSCSIYDIESFCGTTCVNFSSSGCALIHSECSSLDCDIVCASNVINVYCTTWLLNGEQTSFFMKNQTSVCFYAHMVENTDKCLHLQCLDSDFSMKLVVVLEGKRPMHSMRPLYQRPLLGGCYVYNGSVNLLHTQVGVNCAYIWSASWAKASHKEPTRTT